MSEQVADLTLKVEGMSCISCVAHVEGALLDLDGVLAADANLRHGTVRVGYTPERISTAQMQQALQVLGYPSQVAPA
jgi:copper chaperone